MAKKQQSEAMSTPNPVAWQRILAASVMADAAEEAVTEAVEERKLAIGEANSAEETFRQRVRDQAESHDLEPGEYERIVGELESDWARKETIAHKARKAATAANRELTGSIERLKQAAHEARDPSLWLAKHGEETNAVDAWKQVELKDVIDDTHAQAYREVDVHTVGQVIADLRDASDSQTCTFVAQVRSGRVERPSAIAVLAAVRTYLGGVGLPIPTELNDTAAELERQSIEVAASPEAPARDTSDDEAALAEELEGAPEL